MARRLAVLHRGHQHVHDQGQKQQIKKLRAYKVMLTGFHVATDPFVIIEILGIRLLIGIV